jgi:type IV pilus assembly protein PilP
MIRRTSGGKVGVVLLAFTFVLLQGCGSSEQEELSLWMQNERNSIKPDVKPIPEPTKFEPYAYTGERLV